MFRSALPWCIICGDPLKVRFGSLLKFCYLCVYDDDNRELINQVGKM